MSASSIVVDQSGLPVGVASRSRDDIVTGVAVQLTNANDSGVRSWRWELLSRPRGSSAALNSPVVPNPTFTPDVDGTYRVRLTVDAGALGQVDTRVAIVRDGSGFRIPARGEQDEANYDVGGGNQNPDGWWPDMADLLGNVSALGSLTSLDWKASVRLATDAALPANTPAGSGVGKTLTANAATTLTVDGVVANLGDRVLVKDQGSPDDGIYVVSNAGGGVPWVLTRATDADQDAEVTNGLTVHVGEGTANGSLNYTLTTPDPLVVDTDTLAFTVTGGGATPPTAHGLGSASHTSATLAELNALVSDATLDTNTASRPPNGTASGSLTGTYPSPGVADGADGTAIHDNIAGEIAAVGAITVADGDYVLVEDVGSGNVKGRVTAQEIANLGTSVHGLGSASHTAATLAELNALVSDATLDTNTASRPPNGAASGDLGGSYPSPTVNDGADATAIHNNVSGEIAGVGAITVAGGDYVLVEDVGSGNVKGRVTAQSIADLAAGLAAGTTTDAMLRWSGAAWVEESQALLSSSGDLGIEGDLTVGTSTTADAFIAISSDDNGTSESRLTMLHGGARTWDLEKDGTGQLLIRRRNEDTGAAVDVPMTIPAGTVGGPIAFLNSVFADTVGVVDRASTPTGVSGQGILWSLTGGIPSWTDVSGTHRRIATSVGASVDNRFCRFDGTTGRIQLANMLQSDTGQVNGILNMLIDEYITFTASAASTPGAGFARLFYDTADSRLKYRQSGPITKLVGMMPPVVFHAASDGALVATATVSAAGTLMDAVSSATANDGVRLVGKLPETYSGMGLTVRCLISTDSEDAGGTWTFGASFDRVVLGTSQSDTRSYAAARSDSQIVPVTNDETLYEITITFTNSQIDGLLAGEHFVLEVLATTCPNTFYLYTVSVEETP